MDVDQVSELDHASDVAQFNSMLAGNPPFNPLLDGDGDSPMHNDPRAGSRSPYTDEPTGSASLNRSNHNTNPHSGPQGRRNHNENPQSGSQGRRKELHWKNDYFPFERSMDKYSDGDNTDHKQWWTKLGVTGCNNIQRIFKEKLNVNYDPDSNTQQNDHTNSHRVTEWLFTFLCGKQSRIPQKHRVKRIMRARNNDNDDDAVHYHLGGRKKREMRDNILMRDQLQIPNQESLYEQLEFGSGGLFNDQHLTIHPDSETNHTLISVNYDIITNKLSAFNNAEIPDADAFDRLEFMDLPGPSTLTNGLWTFNPFTENEMGNQLRAFADPGEQIKRIMLKLYSLNDTHLNDNDECLLLLFVRISDEVPNQPNNDQPAQPPSPKRTVWCLSVVKGHALLHINLLNSVPQSVSDIEVASPDIRRLFPQRTIFHAVQCIHSCFVFSNKAA